MGPVILPAIDLILLGYDHTQWIQKLVKSFKQTQFRVTTAGLMAKTLFDNSVE